jgi:ABC-2 type transport system permease protein
VTVSDTTADGRRTLVTRTEAPIHNGFSMQSARYAVKRQDHNGVS